MSIPTLAPTISSLPSPYLSAQEPMKLEAPALPWSDASFSDLVFEPDTAFSDSRNGINENKEVVRRTELLAVTLVNRTGIFVKAAGRQL